MSASLPRLPNARGFCGTCHASPARGFVHRPSGLSALYCPHNLVGGVLEPHADGVLRWNLCTPITMGQFLERLEAHAGRHRAAEANDARSAQE